LLVQGSVEGEIDLQGNMTVSAGGRVEAEAEVQSLELAGRATGSMRVSDHVHISSTGMFEGQMATPVIKTRPGSVLRGRATIAGGTSRTRSGKPTR
jgi:cytoskeletal protein CcmA (bactofilin family)